MCVVSSYRTSTVTPTSPPSRASEAIVQVCPIAVPALTHCSTTFVYVGIRLIAVTVTRIGAVAVTLVSAERRDAGHVTVPATMPTRALVAVQVRASRRRLPAVVSLLVS